MAKPIIAIKTRVTAYAALVNLGNRVVASLTGNLSYATPAPALAVLQTAITDVVNAIAVWGPRGNRGSHASLVDLKTKALTLSQTIKSLAQYVQNTAQTAAGSDYALMAAVITTSGFQLSNPKNPQGTLQMVQGFHNFVSRKLNANQVKMKWKKPLNTASAGNVKSYNVYRGTTSVFSAAVQLASTTKTSFIDTNSTSASVSWSYWIAPVNTNGVGVVSNAVTVTVPSM